MGTQELIPVASGLTDLCRLAEYYGTDKAGVYTPFYDLLFRDRREKIYKVLEVGIGTKKAMPHVPKYVPGASLRMWQDYFPNAEIFGLDIDLDVAHAQHGPRVTVFQCDQSSEPSLEGALLKLIAGGRFDLIVDDGSHKPEDQLLTFHILSRLLVPHGLYIIEDVRHDEPEFIESLPEYSYSYVEHWHGKNPGRLILIRGESING